MPLSLTLSLSGQVMGLSQVALHRLGNHMNGMLAGCRNLHDAVGASVFRARGLGLAESDDHQIS
jgi:hypothetical protein